MNKYIILILVISYSFPALTQTSSRFRNEVTNNVNEHDQRIQNSCTSIANRQYNAQIVRLNDPRSWMYSYEVKFLNDCFFNVKMRLMDNHIRLAQTRIQLLRQQAKDKRDTTILNDAKALEKGVLVFKDRQKEERRRYNERDYGTQGRDYITQTLKREIRRVLTEYYEMRAEMRFEGTL